MEHGIIKSLQEKIQSYKDEILKIETAIDVIRRNSVSVNIKSIGNSTSKPDRKTRKSKEKTSKIAPVISEKPISKQVIEFLRSANRFLLPAEIVNELQDRQGKKVADIKLLVNQTLSRLKKEEKLVSFKPERSRSHVWGFKEWVNKSQEPLAEFMPIAED